MINLDGLSRIFIDLTDVVVESLSSVLAQDFSRIESPERMAWIVLVLKQLPDTADIFPCGKRATILNIEAQIDAAVYDYVSNLPQGLRR